MRDSEVISVDDKITSDCRNIYFFDYTKSAMPAVLIASPSEDRYNVGIFDLIGVTGLRSSAISIYFCVVVVHVPIQLTAEAKHYQAIAQREDALQHEHYILYTDHLFPCHGVR